MKAENFNKLKGIVVPSFSITPDGFCTIYTSTDGHEIRYECIPKIISKGVIDRHRNIYLDDVMMTAMVDSTPIFSRLDKDEDKDIIECLSAVLDMNIITSDMVNIQ